MGIWMPGVSHEPLASTQGQRRMTGHNIICLHTMVGSLNGTDGYFEQGGWSGPESHFGTGGYGEIKQWQDLFYSADANLDGWRDVLSIETADMGAPFAAWDTRNGAAVPAWTEKQMDANAKILAYCAAVETHQACPSTWTCHRVGIPLVMIPNTRPGVRGIGYHAQGVPGNGLVAGGVAWSSARGKVCPGARRIAQVTEVINRAKTYSNISVPPAAPLTPEEIDMYLIRRNTDGAIGLVAGGLFTHLNGEEAGVLAIDLGKPRDCNPREWDVTANVMQGNALRNATNAALIASDVRNLLVDPDRGVLASLASSNENVEGLRAQVAALQSAAVPPTPAG